ncbi:YdeI/OmpD-associated family protein [Zhihengliuella alba]|uniref:YdeI/OmpD-associated family protein n=1 Tax=Zhihengliuella alba TaxID=547018 RepID=A0ABP7DHG8_9MICC
MADLPELLVPDADAWHAWLLEHHASSAGVSLVLTKKNGTTTQLTYDQAVAEALCFGWIDGRRNARDAETFANRFTPRRPGGMWSQRNVRLVERLIADGRLQPAGLAQVEAARADGRWERAYAGSASAEPPAELAAALAEHPGARGIYAELNAANRFALYHRVQTLKRPESRVRRARELVALLEQRIAPHPQPGFSTPPRKPSPPKSPSAE